jgi:hypothetical protein
MPRPEDSGGPPPSPFRRLRVAFRLVKTLGIRNNLISKLYQHFRVRVTPTAYRMLYLRLVHLVRQASQPDSAMDPRLDTGGWLALARRGLSPRKIRRAYPGAITKREQPRRPRGLGKATAIHRVGCSASFGQGAGSFPPRGPGDKRRWVSGEALKTRSDSADRAAPASIRTPNARSIGRAAWAVTAARRWHRDVGRVIPNGGSRDEGGIKTRVPAGRGPRCGPRRPGRKTVLRLSQGHPTPWSHWRVSSPGRTKNFSSNTIPPCFIGSSHSPLPPRTGYYQRC